MVKARWNVRIGSKTDRYEGAGIRALSCGSRESHKGGAEVWQFLGLDGFSDYDIRFVRSEKRQDKTRIGS